MSTKAQITTSINTINDGGVNTAAEVRAVFDTLKNNFYPDVITVNQADTSIITLNPALAASITYEVNIYKQGRTVTMNFVLYKNTTALITSWIFQVTNAEYLGKSVSSPVLSSLEYIGLANFANYELQGTLKADNKFYSTLGGGVHQFTLTYQTLN